MFEYENLRRLRSTAALRDLVAETTLDPSDFIYPVFVREGLTEPEPIGAMPGQYRFPVSSMPSLAENVLSKGVKAMLLFGLPSHKTPTGDSCYADDGVVQQAIRAIKKEVPEMIVMTDVCVCAYTDHGHCGVCVKERIDNDATLPILAKMAVSHAEAGADVVAPSSMMDGQVRALRAGLDEAGFADTPVMGYSAKFASAYYGPFREAADSAPSFGDRSAYQHDFRNARHAESEVLDDVSEGADIVMVKPGLAYLDVVYRTRQLVRKPVAVYSVSGEYSMFKAAASQGLIDERKIVLETLTAFRRAGADLVITYYALEASDWLKHN